MPGKTDKWSYAGRTTKRSYMKKNLKDGYKYQFKVVPYCKKDGYRYKSTHYKTDSTITLKKVSMTSVKKYNSSKVKVTWKNIAGESGYQISKSTKKSGTNVVSTFETTKGTYKTLSAARNKTYYYKVRAYKNVYKSGKKYKVYAPWSAVKSYKLK